MCGIEAAYRAGATVMQKPISCHLFPLRIKATAEGDIINYEPFDEICNAGCLNGERLQIPVYVFVKDALIRRYGSDFYEALSATDHFLRS
ncbi:MAG: DUF3109 family protein [Chitinophagia bacterium]|nr:DUF3109 family protein [Chitinophagia bacterium]